MSEIQISVPMTDYWSKAAIAGLKGQILTLTVEGIEGGQRCEVVSAEPSPLREVPSTLLLTLRPVSNQDRRADA